MLEAPDNIMKGGSTQEVLLLQPQLLPLEHVVVGVENSRDILSYISIQDSLLKNKFTLDLNLTLTTLLISYDEELKVLR